MSAGVDLYACVCECLLNQNVLMYHWYLLADKVAHSPHRVCSGSAGTDDDWDKTGHPRSNSVRMLAQGAVEAIPLAGSAGLGFWFDTDQIYFGFLAAGLTLSLVLCWLLRHRVPPTIIHAVEEKPDEQQQLMANTIETK